MTAFLQTSKGTTITISGRNGDIVNSLGAAERGKPGQQIIPHPLNVIKAAQQIAEPINNCNPQSQLQRVQQNLQQRVQQSLQQQIMQNIQEGVRENNGLLTSLQNLQNLQALQNQNQNQNLAQQIEIAEKEAQSQMQNIIVAAIGRAAQQMPTATKLGNSTVAGLKPIAAVAESLAGFVPSQGINMKNYSNGLKTVQTVSQSCFI